MTTINYDATTQTYTIQPGALTQDIQDTIDGASQYSTFLFAAGTHVITQSLIITQDNMTLKGAGEDVTTFLMDFPAGSEGDDGIVIQGQKGNWTDTLSNDASLGDNVITLNNTVGLQAGDVLLVQQANDADLYATGLYDNIQNNSNAVKNPLRESLVEIESINGNVVTLKHNIASDFTGGDATVQRFDVVNNATLSDFTMTYNLGTPDPDLFEDTLPDYKGSKSIYAYITQDFTVSNVTVENTPGHAMEIRSGLEPQIDSYTANGAYNKGATGNGYGLQIAEVFYGEFNDLELIDIRHGVVLSSWHTEAYNEINVTFTNRDINFHGGPDHSNIINVDTVIYSAMDKNPTWTGSWALVSPGGSKHPYTDISQNTVLFKHAEGDWKNDTVTGWDYGAYLDGGNGKDILTGGASDDIIIGGIGNDTLTGAGGRDVFDIRSGDGRDKITDFEVGNGGDYIFLNGFSQFTSFSDLDIAQKSQDVKIYLDGSDYILLQNRDVTDLTIDNFIFDSASIQITTTPAPAPDPVDPVDPVVVVDPIDPVVTPPTTGNTALSTTDQDDYIVTGAGDDIVTSWMSKLTSNDTLELGSGFDTLFINNDYYSFNTNNYTTLTGIDLLDVTSGTQGVNLIIGQSFVENSDTGLLTLLSGSGGISNLDTSAVLESNEVILDGTGDIFLADGVNNRISVNQTAQVNVFGGNGNDYLRYNGGISMLHGGDGNDFMSIRASGNTLFDGGNGNDTFYMSKDYYLNGSMSIQGGEGLDEIRFHTSATLDATDFAGVDGIEQLSFKQSGNSVELNDSIGSGPLHLRGLGGMQDLMLDTSQSTGKVFVEDNLNVTLADGANQTIYALSKLNGTITGGNGDDKIYGNNADDFLFGGSGQDKLWGGENNDVLHGDGGTDRLYGGNGADTLYGDDGRDLLYGSTGDDILIGGAGRDYLYGGDGADIFTLDNNSIDRVKDFNLTAGDQLDISTLLTGFDPLADNINDFVKLTIRSDTRADLSINKDGQNNDFQYVGIVYGDLTGQTVDTLVQNNGLLI